MPNCIHVRQCLRKEPTTREDQLLQRMRREGFLPFEEKRVYQLPKAPGVFSLGPDRVETQVPNDEVVQPVSEVNKHHHHDHYGRMDPHKVQKLKVFETLKDLLF